MRANDTGATTARGGEAPLAAAVHARLQARRDDFVEFLRALTLAESPSLAAASQAPVRELLAERLEALGYRVRRLSGREHGGALYARAAYRLRGAPAQLLIGHYDTVWPLGTLSDMPFRVEGDTVHGPGVYDMKGGLAQIVFALETLAHLGAEPSVTPVVFANADEEIGSRESTRHIRRLARRACRAFVLEPSLGPDGRLKTTRKGVGRFTVEITGKAAHAGLDPEQGASAILELSHVVQSLFALNDVERGVSVNVGTIEGGMRPNVVAPRSGAVVDVRVRTREDGERVSAAIRGLRPSVPGTSLRIEGGIGRPALEPTARNRQLWQQARAIGSELGLELREGLAGGGSDGNTTSLYTATLDGLGPVGDGAHAAHEFLHLDETLRRTALLALLLLAPHEPPEAMP